VHRPRRRTVGALVLLVLGAALLGGCGGDDDGDEAAAFCDARVELADRITELEGFDLSTEEGVPEARERVIALVDALRTMLDAAPEEIRVDADTMAEGLDAIEDRVADADLVQLSTEVPTLLADIGGAGSEAKAEAVASINAYAEEECG
jgi:hypothetical protein